MSFDKPIYPLLENVVADRVKFVEGEYNSYLARLPLYGSCIIQWTSDGRKYEILINGSKVRDNIGHLPEALATAKQIITDSLFHFLVYKNT